MFTSFLPKRKLVTIILSLQEIKSMEQSNKFPNYLDIFFKILGSLFFLLAIQKCSKNRQEWGHKQRQVSKVFLAPLSYLPVIIFECSILAKER